MSRLLNAMVPMDTTRRFTLTTVVVLLAVVTPGSLLLRPRMTAPADPGATRSAASALLHLPIVFARSDGERPPDLELLNENYGSTVLLASEIYEGIDLVLHRATGELEYDFVIRPRARADRIRLTMAGADRLEVDESGDLVVHHAGGQMRQRRPHAYQDTPAGRVDVRADYRIGPDGDVRFAIGKYDRERALVIHPIPMFSTQFRSSSEEMDRR